jgi:hypothetical protein
MAFGKISSGNAFDDFLQSLVPDASSGNRRFVARNFLLDESVDPERQKSYEAEEVMIGHATIHEWEEMHNVYLGARVFLTSLQRADIATRIDTTDEKNCPETFHYQAALREFGTADGKLELIRVEQVDSIASSAGFSSASELLDLANAYLSNRTSDQHKQHLNSALEV